VSYGVAATAISPSGEAIAALLLPCCCVVVWKLGSSWGQRLAGLGQRKAASQLPHCYAAVPPHVAEAWAADMEEEQQGAMQQQQHVDGWRLEWDKEHCISVRWQVLACASLQV
jgi:hypothetical protein